ncbi:transmembrane protein 144 isoform X2 [Magallana gigas]|uniref:transmembrane protein 144 isoform X2 n=1 Tax=Magallana gigas TaxID=29159 RepID=UPI0033424C78
MTQKQFPTWLPIFCIILILFVTLSHATTASVTNQPVEVTFPTAFTSFVRVKDSNSSVNYTTEPTAEPTTTLSYTDFTTINVTTEAYNTTTVEVTTGDYTTAGTTGGTTAATSDNSTLPKYVGFISAGVAVFLYGSNFAPVKKFETGDGMFFQWILCGGALLVGIIVQVIRGTNHFYPLVMLGGLIWETGNICVVPIIKTIGMGLGLCIWGMTNLLSGWATSRFGWFGLTESTNIGDYTLNTVGVIVAVSSSIVFAFVKNNVTPIDLPTDTEPLLGGSSRGSINAESSDSEDSTFIDRLSPGSKRALGIVLSVFSGILYGQMFTPAIYLQDHGHSKNALDYVFACFCGIYSTSTVYFVIYIIFMKNKPKVYPKVILPGVISGLMWGGATAGWFVANQVLSPAIAFPIITTGPSIVASLWGIFIFHEIRGTRNICILLLGFVFVITGAVLTALSEK